ncbi:hypothetical protein ACFYMO_03990 [Streptomyces sp. NPDC007025]|uniref:hypothetical protein n=1 Tax=Streptomyces sp. NPDC007025 TaxID=3364771 RepID=UPI0036771442
MLAGRRTWAWLRVLIQHLPPESHTMTAIRNSLSDVELDEQADLGEPEKGRWSQAEQLLALLADRVAQLQYTLICVNTEKKSQRPDQPEPIRRPGAQPRKKKTAPMSDAAAERLFQLINGGAA